MAEEWIIRVQGKDYGPADLDTLREWKADGRVLPENPARLSDIEQWQTAAEVPGLFKVEPPPIQRTQDRGKQSEVTDQKSESKTPRRNLLTETFRIYFRGFFQFLGLTLLITLPSLGG